MTQLIDYTRTSIYVPKRFQQENPLERLNKLGQQRDRTLNYMVVKAVVDYVEREERKVAKKHGRSNI